MRSWLVCALSRPNRAYSLTPTTRLPALCRPFATLQARLPCHRPQPQLKFFREVGFNLWGFGFPRPTDFGGRRRHSPTGVPSACQGSRPYGSTQGGESGVSTRRLSPVDTAIGKAGIILP